MVSQLQKIKEKKERKRNKDIKKIKKCKQKTLEINSTIYNNYNTLKKKTKNLNSMFIP